MTAYTSSDFLNTYYSQDGEVLTVVFSLAKLNQADTVDITPLIENGTKMSRLYILDHTATILGGFSAGTYASSEAAWSMSVSTDIITITRGNQSADTIVTVEIVPS